MYYNTLITYIKTSVLRNVCGASKSNTGRTTTLHTTCFLSVIFCVVCETMSIRHVRAISLSRLGYSL